MSPRVLLIDHYDSFTYNLAHGLAEHGAEVRVARCDAITAGEALDAAPTHLVLSPGPGRPSETGVSAALVAAFSGRIPILGVCLGHQLLVELEGGVVDRAARLVHGKSASVEILADDALLAGLRSPFTAGRYHSLAAIEPLPPTLRLTARASDGEVMAVQHVSAPTHGVQFHPESVLTPDGPRLLRNFLEMQP